MSATLLYFAYGSNLHPVRLRERAPSAELLGPARLPSHVLRFHKRGRDGSGKCDAWHTGDAADHVLGALFHVAESEVGRLHDVEGVGRGYEVHEVRVSVAHEEAAAFTYRADTAAIDRTLQPWAWYKSLVLAGARHHLLPRDYVARIERVRSLPDPDAERAARHATLLARIEASVS